MKRIKIFIADDHAVFRAGLRSFLEEQKRFNVVGEAGTAKELFDFFQNESVDLLILDISMPGPGLAAILKRVIESQNVGGVVVLTMHEDDRYLREAFSNGARGFVLKKSSASEVTDAINAVHRGQSYVDPELVGVLLEHLKEESQSKNNRKEDGKQSLSPREMEILKLLVHGNTNAEVARQLFISPRTVETHRNHIMEKLGIRTRAELVRYAIENKLFE